MVCREFAGLESATESAESAAATATAATASSSTAAATAVATAEATESTHSLSRLTVAEDVETVDDVKHAVLVDGVVARVAALSGADHTADVALLAEDVVGLEGYSEQFASEETLC